MRVLIAPDGFTGTLTALQAAEAIAAGWREGAPHDDLEVLPLSDGGPGFLDVLEAATPAAGAGVQRQDAPERVADAATVAVTVSDPLSRDVPAAVLVVTECAHDSAPSRSAGAGRRRTAYIESAQACGLHLLGADERNPTLTSTFGVGQLVSAALECRVDRIVVGLGGSGTNDGGAGLLAALGAGPAEALARGGLALAAADDDALAGLPDVRARLAGVDLVVATDVDSPLLGMQGASAVFAAQKGATAEQAQALEGALGRFTEIAERTLRPRTDLLSGGPLRLDREPGAGAAGGLGYGLLLLGGRRVGGVDAILDAVDIHGRLSGTDLVVTGEGSFDWQSLRGKVAVGLARAAQEHAVAVVLIAGQVLVGRRETMALGLNGAYAVAETPDQVEAAHLDPVGTLRERTIRVARTWSPRR